VQHDGIEEERHRAGHRQGQLLCEVENRIGNNDVEHTTRLADRLVNN